VGKRVTAFTICLAGKACWKLDDFLFGALKDALVISLRAYKCEAHIYLAMPDHMHLLIEGSDVDSDTWKCIVAFKQRSGYWLSQNKCGARWQKDFYDHILRKDEDIEKQVRYILANPVRQELARSWREYRFKGSTIYNFDEWRDLS
jgi:REP element-mobilizing transposase RayT